jgi:hypothetical protein
MVAATISESNKGKKSSLRMYPLSGKYEALFYAAEWPGGVLDLTSAET